jgi:hypothetical protein
MIDTARGRDTSTHALTLCDRVKISRSDGYRPLKLSFWLTVFLKKTARVHDTITRESDGLVPLSPWSWTCLPFTQGRRE